MEGMMDIETSGGNVSWRFKSLSQMNDMIKTARLKYDPTDIRIRLVFE